MKRESMVFYESFYEAVKDLDAETFKKCVSALLEYGINGEEPKTNGIEKTVFIMAKPQIDKNNKRYTNSKSGGAPEGNDNALKQPNRETKQPNTGKSNQTAKQNNQSQQNVEKKQPNVNDNVNDNDLKEKDNTNVLSKKKNFEPPTLEEVTEYINSNNYPVNPEQFIDYYQARGWYLTKNRRVTDWKACVRTWVRNGYDTYDTAKSETKPKESEFDRFMRELSEA